MGMLQHYAGQELIWESSRSAKRTYELRSGDQSLATLIQPSAWNQRRVASSDEGTFTFARVGFFKQRIVIADATANAEVANMPPSGWSGKSMLTLPDGRIYHWRKSGFWGMKWTWLDGAEQPLMSFKQVGAFRVRCVVTIEPAAAADPHLALLAQLGWFLMLLAQADAATSSSAASSVAVSG
ncbi:MAG: hypothetical protein ACXVDA_10365 [Ktedonobacterales bacterium]